MLRVAYPFAAACLLLLSSACGEPGQAPPDEGQCREATGRIGEVACVHRVDSDATWKSVALPLDRVDQPRAAKYMVPARPDARLAPLLLNSNRYEFHYEFMKDAFGELFPGLTTDDYVALLFDPERREYYVGSLIELNIAASDKAFGFTLETDPTTGSPLDCDVVRSVRAEWAARLPAAELFVLPSSKLQLEQLPACNIPMYDPSKGLDYEPYHPAVGFGTLRRYDAKSLPDAVENVEFGFQDILVLDEAPIDLERIVSGAITGTRQGALSHLAVRSASRGTPNCYLRDAYDLLSRWEGKLVRVECTASTLLVREAKQAEAEAFWEKLKPEPVEIPAPDRSFAELVELTTLAVATPEDRALGVRRFGAKGTNLAWLRQHLEAELTPPGFLMPMHYYDAFLKSTKWTVDLGAGMAAHSLAETLDAWLADETFLSDAKLRRERLTALQAAFEAGACDAAALTAIGSEIESVFGSTTEMVRLRSSSNAEDGAYFNGAGLYDSYSGCLADDRDADEQGPSLCDPSKDEERGVCRALKKVWASLWNVKAFEERAFFGIDQRQVTMGVLVNGRSEAELANMVAFTGNPVLADDQRYLVNAQVGELAVVSPDPGMWPEQDLLTLEDGKVSKIERAGSSSELPQGKHVLSDAQLKTLGQHLAELAALYPIDQAPPAGRTFILDTEWKVMPDGALRIKQVRPFLK